MVRQAGTVVALLVAVTTVACQRADAPEPRATAGTEVGEVTEEARATTPEAPSSVADDGGYPRLNTVPPRPRLTYTVQQERAIVEGLVADLENARYTNRAIRYRAGLSTLPPPPPPSTVAVAEAAAAQAEAMVPEPPPPPAASAVTPPQDTMGPVSGEETLNQFMDEAAKAAEPPPPAAPSPAADESIGPTSSNLAPAPSAATAVPTAGAGDRAGPTVAADARTTDGARHEVAVPEPASSGKAQATAVGDDVAGGLGGWFASLFDTDAGPASDAPGPNEAGAEPVPAVVEPIATASGGPVAGPTKLAHDGAAAVMMPASVVLGTPAKVTLRRPAPVKPLGVVAVLPSDDTGIVVEDGAIAIGDGVEVAAGGPDLVIAFAPDSAALTPAAAARLERLVGPADPRPTEIAVTGEGADPALAVDRARAIAIRLVQLGVSADAIEVGVALDATGDRARVRLDRP